MTVTDTAGFKNGASGFDDINASLFKTVSSILLSLLCYAIYQWNKEYFQINWEWLILYHYGADDPFMSNNYRPVTLGLLNDYV